MIGETSRSEFDSRRVRTHELILVNSRSCFTANCATVKLLAEMVYLVVLFAAILVGFVEGVRWFGPRQLIVNGFNLALSQGMIALLLEEAILIP